MDSRTLSQLSPDARKMLEIIIGNTSIDGGTLMRYASKDNTADLVGPIRELQSYELIEVGGSVSPDAFPFARFAVRPSLREYLSSMLKRMPG